MAPCVGFGIDAIHHEVDEHLLQLEITQDLYSSGTVLRVENVVDPTLVGCARLSRPSTPPFFEHRPQVIPAVVTRRFRSAQERSRGACNDVGYSGETTLSDADASGCFSSGVSV